MRPLGIPTGDDKQLQTACWNPTMNHSSQNEATAFVKAEDAIPP